ncbi:hypothetical protein V6N13_140324 [Hibiscus sabdariffa]|uniref:Uncharacterized protein n=1 Tax=Hibiscus sabdariffa TaxID=183260 RepID=A0ABR2QAE9_9ROSI
MSDPLTALMHTVQVMNLFQTLIMKSLREREETASSLYAFDGPKDEEFDCHSLQEMDTSSEEPMSDYDNSLYANSSGDDNEYEDEDEIEPLGEIEENKDVTYSFLDEPADKLHASTPPGSWSGCNVDSGISFIDSKNENSGLSTSDGEGIDDMETTYRVVEADSTIFRTILSSLLSHGFLGKSIKHWIVCLNHWFSQGLNLCVGVGMCSFRSRNSNIELKIGADVDVKSLRYM